MILRKGIISQSSNNHLARVTKSDYVFCDVGTKFLIKYLGDVKPLRHAVSCFRTSVHGLSSCSIPGQSMWETAVDKMPVGVSSPSTSVVPCQYSSKNTARSF